MPIDPNSVQWDDDVPAQGAPEIDPAAIAWDDAPAKRPTGILGWFAGPAPIQGDTMEARQADYQSRNPLLKAAVGVGQMMDSNIRGANQLAGTPNAAMEANSRATNEMIAGDGATAVGRFGAEAAALAAPGRAVSMLPKLAARLGGGAALGAGYGALQAEDGPGERMTNALMGGAFGAGGEVLGQGVRALGRKLPEGTRAVYEAAKARGIDLTPAQLSDSWFLKRAESMLRSLPLNGAKGQWDKQVRQFNSALGKSIGEQDVEAITPDVYSRAITRVGDQFDDLASKSTLTVSDDLLERLGSIQQEVAEMGDDGTIRAVNSLVDRLLRQSKDGKLPGEAYKSINSQIGKIASQGGEKGHYLGEVRDAIRDGMDGSIAPELSEAWRQARGQYRALKTIEPLVAKAGNEGVQPGALMSRVTADKSGKAAMARGRGGELGELAKIGQQMKAPPSSGTPEGLFAGSMWNPIAWAAYPPAALAGLAGRSLNGGALARLMASDTRPATAKALARLVGPAAIASSSAAAAPVKAKERRRLDGR